MSDLESGNGLLEECFRWFGPDDPVRLPYIRQAGATAIFTSLHQIPYGEEWPREEIRKRRELLESAGFGWAAVESVPVHEDIKANSGEVTKYLDRYSNTLRNLASEGVTTVIYNFMPVLDWVRTDIRHVLSDGSECLKYDPAHFAAFEIHALGREGAEKDYAEKTKERASSWWARLSVSERGEFVQTIIDVFPGVKLNLSLDDIRTMLARYAGIDKERLRENLARFLEFLIPVAEEVGVKMAIHPDDPPFPLLGLPRIVSTAEDIEWILHRVESPSNGLCFCTGSLGARADNNLPEMVARFGPQIHAAHLRSTLRLPDGSFFEANHLEGSVDMSGVVGGLLNEQDRRKSVGRTDWQIPFRPDHGHTMMDDLNKPPLPNPGYSCIGRMRGMAEIRGLMHGLNYSRPAQVNG